MLRQTNLLRCANKFNGSSGWFETSRRRLYCSIVSDRPSTEIPGPKEYPIVASIPSIIMHKEYHPNHMNKFWQALFDEYGPIVKIDTVLDPPIVAIWKPEHVETLYRATSQNPVRFGLESLHKVRLNNPLFKGRGGISTSNDEEWRRLRTNFHTLLMKPKNLIKYLPHLDQITLDFLDRISDLQNEEGEMPANFIQEIYKWGFESIYYICLNKRFGCLSKDLAKDSLQLKIIRIIKTYFAALNDTEMGVRFWKFFPTPSILRLQRVHDLIAETLLKQIIEREQELKQNPSPEDSLTILEEYLRNPELDRIDVLTIMIDLLSAGIDTTSHTLSFALYSLAKNPRVQKKLQNEVDNVLGDGQQPITEAQLNKLPYLKLCLKESMRMYPPVLGTTRILQNDLVLSGYTIPKGWVVFSLNMITSMNKSIFSRHEEFIPERWERDGMKTSVHPFSSIPFSHGSRMCIGRRVAELEIHTFLARVMQRYNLEYHHNDMNITTRLVLVPNEPLRFKFIPRKN